MIINFFCSFLMKKHYEPTASNNKEIRKEENKQYTNVISGVQFAPPKRMGVMSLLTGSNSIESFHSIRQSLKVR